MFVPQKITIKGFLTFDEDNEQVVDLSKLSLASISGSNGEGKTTIFHALVWAIYGVSRVKSDIDSVVNYGSKHAVVTVDAMVGDGQMVRVRRTRTFGKESSLVVQKYDEDDSEWGDWNRSDEGDHTIKTTQSVIDGLVGMPYEVFCSMIYLDQRANGMNLFASSDSKTRRSILMSLIPDQSKWGQYESDLRDKRAETKRLITASKARLDSIGSNKKRLSTNIQDIKGALKALRTEHDLQAEIDSLRAELRALSSTAEGDSRLNVLRTELQEVRRRTKELIRSNERRIATLEDEIRQYEHLSESRDNVKSRHARLNDDTVELEDQIEEQQELLKELRHTDADVTPKLAAATAKVKELRDEIAGARADLKQAKKRANEISNPCHLCGNAMSDDKFAEVHQHADADVDETSQQITKIETALEKAVASERNLDKRLSSTKKKIASCESLISQHQSGISANDKILDSLEERHDEIKKSLAAIDIKAIQKAMADTKSTLDQLRSDTTEQKILNQIESLGNQDNAAEIVRAERTIQRLSKELSEHSNLRTTLTVTQQELDTATTQESDERDELDRLTELEEDYDTLVVACSPKGAPSLMIESVLTEIARKQNEYLKDLTSGGKVIGVKFTQARAKKKRGRASTETTSEIDIIAQLQDGTTRRIESLSPGEQVRVALSNLFAMIEVFNSMKPGLARWIMMDEPFVHLDDSAIPVAMNIIHNAIDSGAVDRVLMISHQQPVINSAKQHITVTRGSDDKPSISVQG